MIIAIMILPKIPTCYIYVDCGLHVAFRCFSIIISHFDLHTLHSSSWKFYKPASAHRCECYGMYSLPRAPGTHTASLSAAHDKSFSSCFVLFLLGSQRSKKSVHVHRLFKKEQAGCVLSEGHKQSTYIHNTKRGVT